MPETDKVLLLDFSTGEKLWLYAEDDAKPMTCFIVRYVSIDNEEYTFMTVTEYRFANLEKLVSMEFENTLWDK